VLLVRRVTQNTRKHSTCLEGTDAESQEICKISISSTQPGSIITYWIILGEVKLFLYKIQMQHTLHDTDKTRTADLCDDFNMFLEDNPAIA
jgi:hypothetical protein